MVITKAVKYDEWTKMKRDARLKAVLKKTALFIFGRLSYVTALVGALNN